MIAATMLFVLVTISTTAQARWHEFDPDMMRIKTELVVTEGSDGSPSFVSLKIICEQHADQRNQVARLWQRITRSTSDTTEFDVLNDSSFRNISLTSRRRFAEANSGSPHRFSAVDLHTDSAFNSATQQYTCSIGYYRVDWDRSRYENGTESRSEKIFTNVPTIITAPQPPTGLSVDDQLIAEDRVVVSWDKLPNGTDATANLDVTEYTIGRRVGTGPWAVLGSVQADQDGTFADIAPYAGPVTYGVRTETIVTNPELSNNVTGAWASIDVTITPKALGPPPRDLRVAPHNGSYRLNWSEPENQRDHYVTAYEVWFKTESSGFAQVTPLVTQRHREWNLAQDTMHAELIGAQHPIPGALYTFYVRAAREDGSDRSDASEHVTIGTETAPLVYLADPAADQGTGWMRISWAPGPNNGNGAPRDSIDWIVRWRPVVPRAGEEESAWRINRLRDPNSRSLTLAVRESVLDPDAFNVAQRYEIQVGAESVNGPGAYGHLGIQAIDPVARGGSLTTSTTFEHTATGIRWWLEGPTEVFLGERVWYALRGERVDSSNTTPLDGMTDFMVRPVGVREVETVAQGETRIHIGEMDQVGQSCGPGGNQVAINGGGRYKVCVHTVGYNTNVLGGPKTTYQRPSTSGGGSAAFLAYRPTGSGVPYGHKMEVQIRNEDRYADTTFQVGIGIWYSGAQARAELRSNDRKFTVTIRRAPPLPPRDLGVSEIQNDSNVDVYRLTWDTSSNVVSDRLRGYHVHQRRGNNGSFEQVTTSPITEQQYDVNVPVTATAFAWYVTTETTDNKVSEPSDTVQVGVPTTPPTNVQATAPGQGVVEVSWAASADDSVTGYRVDVTSDSGQTWTERGANVNGLSFRDTGQVVARTLHYRVTPLNALGDGPPGAVAKVEVETLEGLTAPGAPNNIQVQVSGRHGIVIAWEPPTENGGVVITGYTIQRSTTGEDVDFTPLPNSVDNLTRFYADQSLEAGTTYHYRVQAENDVGIGDLSNSASATTRSEAAPDAPRRLLTEMRADGASITLSWLAPPDVATISGYRIERVPEGEGLWTAVGGDLDPRTTAFEDTYTDPAITPMYRYRVSAFNLIGSGEPVASEAASPSTPLNYTSADLNVDTAINASDALILYYALAFRKLVGDGTSGGFDDIREQIMEDHVGTLTADDSGYRQLVANAREWSIVGLENGGDLNQDSFVDEEDALLMYYAHTLQSQLGNGDAQSGTAAFRETFLGPYTGHLNATGDAAARDTALRGILMQARAITLE